MVTITVSGITLSLVVTVVILVPLCWNVFDLISSLIG